MKAFTLSIISFFAYSSLAAQCKLSTVLDTDPKVTFRFSLHLTDTTIKSDENGVLVIKPSDYNKWKSQPVEFSFYKTINEENYRIPSYFSRMELTLEDVCKVKTLVIRRRNTE